MIKKQRFLKLKDQKMFHSLQEPLEIDTIVCMVTRIKPSPRVFLIIHN